MTLGRDAAPRAAPAAVDRRTQSLGRVTLTMGVR